LDHIPAINGGIIVVNEEIAPHVRDIARVLEGVVDEEEIRKELQSYLNLYRVSLESAKRGIVRKYGGDPNRLARGVRKEIAELGLNEQSVDLLVRVVSVNEKEIDRNGDTIQMLYGIFGDESGTIPFTAWDAERFDLQKSGVYLIRNAYTREWNGKPQVNLGNRAIAEPQDPEMLSVPESASSSPENVRLHELKEGMGSVNVTGRVLSVEERQVNVSGETKTIYSGLLADDRGKVQYSAWDDFDLQEGEVVTIRNGYVRSWRGIPQLNFGERSEVIRSDESLPPAEELLRPALRGIDELEKVGGGVDVMIRGVVVDIKKGSGLIFRCPECNRPVQGGTCRIHGKVKAEPDLRIKAVVDDGNFSLTAILNREMTEELLGLTLEESLKAARESMNQEVVREEIEEKLLAHPVELSGNVTSDEFGLMMIVTGARFFRGEVREEAKKLLAEMEGGA